MTDELERTRVAVRDMSEGARRRTLLASRKTAKHAHFEPSTHETLVDVNARREASGLRKLDSELLSRRFSRPATEGETASSAISADLPPEQGGSGSVQSIGITDLDRAPALHLGETADPYLREVEEKTAIFRVARSLRGRRRAHEIATAGEPDPLPDDLSDDVRCAWVEEPGPAPHTPIEVLAATEKRRSKAAWHLSRAKGALERFPRVADCRKKKAVATCARSCGHVRKIDLGCSVGRLCLRCRAIQAVDRRERFDDASSRRLRRLDREGLSSRHRHRDLRWGAKFITLTCPHASVDAIEGARDACDARGVGDSHRAVVARCDLMREAWRYFSIKLQRWGKQQRKRCNDRARLAWYRAFEWTAGADGDGHPHFHVWLIAPYLPKDLLDGWWTYALERAGLSMAGVQVVTDIRPWRAPTAELIKGAKAIKGQARDFVDYVEGWSIVDCVDGYRISADVAARLYEALDGARLVQTSRAFLVPVVDVCPACGCHGSTDVRIMEGVHACDADAPARGPPP